MTHNRIPKLFLLWCKKNVWSIKADNVDNFEIKKVFKKIYIKKRDTYRDTKGDQPKVFHLWGIKNFAYNGKDFDDIRHKKTQSEHRGNPPR